MVAGVAMAIGWVVIGQLLGATIEVENIGVAMTLYYTLLFVPLLLLAVLLGRLGHRPVFRKGQDPVRWAAIGAALGATGFLVTLAYSWLNGGIARATESGGVSGLVLLGIVLTFGQVLTEEVLFRGWLQPALSDRTGPLIAVMLGAAIFAVFHIPAGALSALSLVSLVLGGIWFGLLALRSGGILAPLAAHFAWNVIEDSGFGLVPNPGTGPLGALTDHDLLGAALWGATAEGLNASIGTSLVLLALIIPFLRSNIKREVPVVA
jgi:membrane protease YdiL (CAAX protease family)